MAQTCNRYESSFEGVYQSLLILLLGLMLSTIPAKADSIQFASANSIVDEFSLWISVTVTRTGSGAGTVRVLATTRPGTATAGKDYMDVSATLEFPAGATLEYFYIPIYEDSLAEGDETVLLTLSNPTGGAVLGSPSTSVLTIRNSGPLVEFEASQYSAREGDGPALITVRRRGDDNVPVSVEFATGNGTATAREDYTPVAGRLEFGAGENRKVIAVPILDDGLVEFPEQVELILTNVSEGATLGWSTTTLVIDDNEIPASLDYGFNPAVNWGIQALGAQPDGKTLIGGWFDSVNGQPVHGIARFASDGSLDTTFRPEVTSTYDGKDYPGAVSAIVVLANGKILMRGSFSEVDGISRYGMARLNADGSLDTSFEPLQQNLESASLIVPQPDGKMLFLLETGMIRLNPDGSLDSTFTPALGFDEQILSIALQSDGTILIGTENGMARLKPDGSLDNSFNRGPTEGAEVRSILVQPDDKVLVAGFLSKPIDGDRAPGVVRLNADGSIDPSFSVPPGMISVPYFYKFLSLLLLQPDGRILVNKGFEIVRLNADGSLDPGFVVGKLAQGVCVHYCPPQVQSMVLQPDGKILIQGYLNAVNGVPRPGLARLNPEPSLLNIIGFVPGGSVGGEAIGTAKVTVQRLGDTSGSTSAHFATVGGSASSGADYVPQTGTIAFGPLEVTKTFAIPVIDDGLVEADETIQVLLRDSPAGTVVDPFPGAVMLVDDERPGSLDLTFDPKSPGGADTSLAMQPDGKILFAHGNSLVRVHADGSPDRGFVPPVEPGDSFSLLALQTDGRILVSGYFGPDGSQSTIRRLTSDGQLDPTFHAALPSTAWNIAIAVEPNNRVYVIYSTSSNGVEQRPLVRLQPDGALDTEFNLAIGPGDYVDRIAVQPDGNILVASVFGANAEQRPYRLARFHADGSLDTSFVSDIIPQGSVVGMLIQPDGRILLIGSLTGWDYSALRLNPDGSLDSSFSLDAVLMPRALLAIQPDGKILVAVSYYEDPDGYRDRIVRVHPDGTWDRSFDPGALTIALCVPYYCPLAIGAAAAQPDGRIVVAGNFSAVNGVSRNGIARLNGDARYVRLVALTPMSDRSVRVRITSQPGKTYLLQTTSDLTHWIDLGTKVASGFALELDDLNAAGFDQRFYRVLLVTP